MIIGRKRRFVTLFIPLILLLTLFVGCASRQKIPDQTTATSPSETTAVATTAATTAADTTAQTTEKLFYWDYIEVCEAKWAQYVSETVFDQGQVDTSQEVVEIFKSYLDLFVEVQKDITSYEREYFFSDYRILGQSQPRYAEDNGKKTLTVGILYRRLPNVPSTEVLYKHFGQPIDDIYGCITEGELAGWDVCVSEIRLVQGSDGGWRVDGMRPVRTAEGVADYELGGDLACDYVLIGSRDSNTYVLSLNKGHYVRAELKKDLEELYGRKFSAEEIDTREEIVAVYEEYLGIFMKAGRSDWQSAKEYYGFEEYVIFGMSDISYSQENMENLVELELVYRRKPYLPPAEAMEHLGSPFLDLYGYVTEGELKDWYICRTVVTFVQNGDGSYSFRSAGGHPGATDYDLTDDIGAYCYLYGEVDRATGELILPPSK
ncbi:MAG: hypothetical protein IKM04_03240 [Clostridia bacterium]|nr:hypothetical protein [Clostridia bacterium]